MFFGPGGLPQFGVNTPLPHSAPNAATSPFYKFASDITTPKAGGDYFFFNYAAFTPALPPADRQAFYGSFTRDLCDKYLVLFADFKYVRSFFDASLAAVPFLPDPFKTPGTDRWALALPAPSVCQSRIRLIRSPSRMRLWLLTESQSP